MLQKFILRTIAFLSIPVAILGGWSMFIVLLDYHAYVSSLPAPNGKNIVVCGDSQTKDSLDPTYFPELYNFSTAASNPDQNLLRLKDLLAANAGSFDYVLIDITTLQLGHEEITPLADLGSARVHALLNFYHLHEVTRPFGSLAKIFRDVILVRKFHEFRKSVLRGRRYRSSLSGGFDAVTTKGFIEHSKKAMKDLDRKVAAFNQKALFSADDQLAKAIKAQADVVKKAGLRPVFMMTPVFEAYLRKMNRESVLALSNGIAAIAAEYDAPFFNYLDRTFPIEYWRDANHMNADGAAAFTKIFRNDFKDFLNRGINR